MKNREFFQKFELMILSYILALDGFRLIVIPQHEKVPFTRKFLKLAHFRFMTKTSLKFSKTKPQKIQDLPNCTTPRSVCLKICKFFTDSNCTRVPLNCFGLEILVSSTNIFKILFACKNLRHFTTFHRAPFLQ